MFKILLLVSLVNTILSAPVPIPENQENTVEEEDGILVLVPTISADQKNDDKTEKEIDYELISIPGSLIRNTVKKVSKRYTKPGKSSSGKSAKDESSQTLSSIFMSNLKTGEEDEIFVKSPSSRSGTIISGGNSGDQTSDLSKIISKLASVGLSQVSTGSEVLSQARNAISSATAVGTSALTQGAKAVKWAVKAKTSSAQSIREFAGHGFHYVGRLTSALLKILLKIPGIKARVISDVIQAGQPFASALSDVIADSADDLSEVFNAQSGILRETLGLLIRFVRDLLAVKGRIIAHIGSGGLSKGTNLISSGVKVGGAFVQSAGDVVNAVGRGVGEIVEAVSSANIPTAPRLPTIKFPKLPTIVFDTDSTEHSSQGTLNQGKSINSETGSANALEILLNI